MSFFFFFNDTATTEIYTLSLHDALPISPTVNFLPRAFWRRRRSVVRSSDMADAKPRNLRRVALGTTGLVLLWLFGVWPPDRKSTRLNSSHGYISYAVFCLKKKKTTHTTL